MRSIFSRVCPANRDWPSPGPELTFPLLGPGERSRALHSKSVVMNTAPRRVDCGSFKHSTSAWWLVNEYPLHHRRRDWFPTKVGLKWRLYGRRDAPSGEAERQERRRGHGRERTSLADDWVTVGTTSLSAHRCSMLEARPPVLSNERSGNVQAPFRCGPHKEFVEGWRRTGRWAGLLSVEENFSLNENDWCRHTKSHFKLAWQRSRNRPDASQSSLKRTWGAILSFTSGESPLVSSARGLFVGCRGYVRPGVRICPSFFTQPISSKRDREGKVVVLRTLVYTWERDCRREPCVDCSALRILKGRPNQGGHPSHEAPCQVWGWTPVVSASSCRCVSVCCEERRVSCVSISCVAMKK